MPRDLPRGFYGILSEPRVGWLRLARLMVDAGVPVIQLRAKRLDGAQLLRLARQIRAVVPQDRVFLVNDRPDVAALVGADGVHLGQEDAPLVEARARLGPAAVIGLSTHDLGQVRAACALAPTYIGVGPVFPTRTKERPDPVLGLEGLAALCAAATVPTVAIGGIDLGNLDAVLRARPHAVCAVGAVNASADPGPVLAALMRRVVLS